MRVLGHAVSFPEEGCGGGVGGAVVVGGGGHPLGPIINFSLSLPEQVAYRRHNPDDQVGW